MRTDPFIPVTPDPIYRESNCNLPKFPFLLLSQDLLDLGLHVGSLLGLGESDGLVLQGDGLPLLLGLLLTLNLLEGILTDGLVGLGVEVLETVSLDVVLNVLGELAVVALLIVIGEGLHVLGNVATVDVLAEGLGIQLLALHVVTRESLLGVGDEDATVGGTLESTEDTGTGGGTGKTNVKEGLEGAALAIVGLSGLGEGELTVSLLNTDKVLVEAELGEDTAGDQETGGIGGRPVGQTVVDAVSLQLVGVGSDQDLVTRDLRADDLHDDVLVGEADDQAVLGSIVLVLGLGDEALTSVVVGLSLTSALVLGLVAAVVEKKLATLFHRIILQSIFKDWIQCKEN